VLATPTAIATTIPATNVPAESGITHQFGTGNEGARGSQALSALLRVQWSLGIRLA
jgi:hypothetical protein